MVFNAVVLFEPLQRPMLKSLLDIFFPPVCPLCEDKLLDGPLCKDCGAGFSSQRISGPLCKVCGIPFTSKADPSHTCGQCLTEKVPFTEARSAFVYSGSVLDAIHSFKYSGKVILAKPLGSLLSGAAIFSSKPDIIVPVPLHKKRLGMRGFNQSLMLAKEAARHLSIGIDYLNLKRVRFTEQQTNLASEERRKNVSGAFEVKNPEAFKSKRVLLVDDVFTTGATVRECSKVLKKAGAEVYVLTLARTLKV